MHTAYMLSLKIYGCLSLGEEGNMRLLIILLFVAAAAMADVEIVPLSTDSDVSFVSWIGTDGFAHLGRYEGDSLVTEITTVGDYDASVGVCEFQP